MGNKLDTQEPLEVEENNDIFGVYNLAKRVRELLIENQIKETKKSQIIGIFDGFGEGKSTFLKTFIKFIEEKNDESDNKQFCIVEFDLWKYNSQELKNQFDKVFAEERAPYFLSDKSNILFKRFTSYIPGTGKLAKAGMLDNSLDRKLRSSNFRYGLKNSIKEKRNRRCKSLQDQEVVVVLENLDRLTIEDKILALTSLYNHKDYLESNVLVLVDPNSIREGGNHFENLIHKCFTSSFYLDAKSEVILRDYIEYKTYQSVLETHYEAIGECILSQYPISLRVINHILNNLTIQLKINNFSKALVVKSILQVLHPKLYTEISLNPYKLINSSFSKTLTKKQKILLDFLDANYTNIDNNFKIFSPKIDINKERCKLLLESKNFDIVTNNLIESSDIKQINIAFSNYSYFVYVLKGSKFQTILISIKENKSNFIFPKFESLEQIKETMQINNFIDLYEQFLDKDIGIVKKAIFKNPKLYSGIKNRSLYININEYEYLDIVSELEIKDRVLYYVNLTMSSETDILLKYYDLIKQDLIALNKKDLDDLEDRESIEYLYFNLLIRDDRVKDINKYITVLLKSKLFTSTKNQNKLNFFMQLLQKNSLNFDRDTKRKILSSIIECFDSTKGAMEKSSMLKVLGLLINIDDFFDNSSEKRAMLKYYLKLLIEDFAFNNSYGYKIRALLDIL